MARELEPMGVGSHIGEKMVMLRISEAAAPGPERYIIDR